MTRVERRLPSDHPLHRRLADEVHARPPVEIPSPGVAAYVALWRDEPAAASDASPAKDFEPLRQLAARHGVALPDVPPPHVVVDLPRLRIKWERHSEFTSYTFIQPLESAATDTLQDELPSAFGAVPPEWLASLPGRTIAAVDVVLLPAQGDLPPMEQIAPMFGGTGVVGAHVAGGVARVFTDYRLSDDGRERWVVLDGGMTRGQQARVVQRLTEIAVYRVAALLAFPVARETAAQLSAAEGRLAAVMATISELGRDRRAARLIQREERRLLDELMHLAAEIERSVATTNYRFSAARAYWEIINNRVAELREERIGGVATIGEFLSRRLAPAINTVLATARRQQALSERVARAGDLLRTRVDVAREEQNQQILAAMDRRSKLSLRLQQTVEGLSVAAITYYAVGLVGYIVKAAKHAWPAIEPDWVTAIAIPILALLIWRAAHRVRKELEHHAEPGDDEG
ncbi:MAG TPA: DUF3422 domain-containing protein [Burkholderiaceae bacterium]|nr:DUF3422 domain-containing protein [Burkholderiaceae bacterium]